MSTKYGKMKRDMWGNEYLTEVGRGEDKKSLAKEGGGFE